MLACAAAVFALTRPGDVFNPDVEFRASRPRPPSGSGGDADPEEEGQEEAPARRLRWAQYGYRVTGGATADAARRSRPPWKIRWNFDANVLLEFPPIIVGDRLFLTRNDGQVVALTS